LLNLPNELENLHLMLTPQLFFDSDLLIFNFEQNLKNTYFLLPVLWDENPFKKFIAMNEKVGKPVVFLLFSINIIA
jgi:hypothetical protein